jgi:hypothetical protein
MTIAPAVPRRKPGRPYLAAGLALGALGVLGYAVQLWLRHLSTPWYMPIAATLGVLLLVVSLWQARTVWRVLGLVVLLLLAGAEWALLLGSRLPEYAGPVEVAEDFPAFSTVRADGTPFTRRDLVGEQNSVLVSFRGRW